MRDCLPLLALPHPRPITMWACGGVAKHTDPGLCATHQRRPVLARLRVIGEQLARIGVGEIAPPYTARCMFSCVAGVVVVCVFGWGWGAATGVRASPCLPSVGAVKLTARRRALTVLHHSTVIAQVQLFARTAACLGPMVLIAYLWGARVGKRTALFA